MAARDRDTPLYSYLLAVIAGLFCTWLLFFFVVGLVSLLFESAGDSGLFVPTAIVFCNAFVGAVFGLVWPGPMWRWGVWLSAGPVCAVSFFGPSAVSFAALVTLTLPPACAGAYAAARVHLKYVEVE